MRARLISFLQGGIARAFAGTMAVAVPARFAQLAMTLLLARRLGPEAFGLFVFAQGFSQLGGRLGALGWPTLLLRMIPAYETEKDWSRLRGIMRAAIPVVALACLVVAFLTAAYAVLANVRDGLSQGLLFGALLLPVMGMRALMRNMLAGFKYPSQGILLDELMPPALTCLAVLAFSLTSPTDALLAYLIVSAIAVFYGAAYVRRITPADTKSAEPTYEFQGWMAIALPALVGMSAKLIMNRTDVVMLAPLSDLEEVSRYAVALRVTFVQTFPIVVLSAVLGPRISAAITAGKTKRVEKLYFGGLLFAGGFSALVAIGLIIWRTQIMAFLFGSEYTDSAPVLAALSLAQIAASLGIPAASFMIMSGREKLFGAVTLVALALNIAMNFALIPQFGALGAALATATSAACLTGFQMWVGFRAIRDWRRSPSESGDA